MAVQNYSVCLMVFNKNYKTVYTSWQKLLQAMKPGFMCMIQKQNSCYHSMNLHSYHIQRSHKFNKMSSAHS